MAAARRADLRRLDTTLLLVCLVLLAIGIAYPAARMVWEALASWTNDALVRGPGLRAILNTVLIGLGSVFGAGILGTALALVLARYSFPGRRALAALAYLPFTLPPMAGVLSFYYLIGRDGMLTRSLQLLPGVENAQLPGPAAILLVHTYSFYVFFYAMVSAALEGMDRSLFEAARNLGASPSRVFFRVTLPLLRPALAGAALLTFMSSAASFSAPFFFGRDFPTLSVQIFLERTQNHQPEAMTLTLLLAAVSLCGLVLFRSRDLYAGGGSKGVPSPLRSARARLFAGLGAWVAVLLILTPHLLIVCFAFVDYGAWYSEIFPRAFTLENFRDIFASGSAFAPIRNSLWMSAFAAAGTLALGLPAAYLIGRARPGARVLYLLVMIPWALPGTVVAMNLIVAFNDSWLPLYNTHWLLPLAYLVRDIPLVTRMNAAAIETFDPALMEAAQTLGASRSYAFRRIALPLLAPTAVIAAAMAFTASLGEFPASILLYHAGNEPIAVRIYNESRAAVGPAFAYSLLLVLLVGLSFALARRASARLI